MHFVMQPGMVYHYPLWGVGLLLVSLAGLGAVFIELAARQFLSVELRRRHNDAAAAIFSIIGVTFAVLLAFVAMLAWEGFNKAKAASYAEAALVRDVYNVSAGLADPEMTSMRDDLIGYVETVVRVEWPAQAEGRTVDRGTSFLERLNRTAVALKPSSVADGNLHVQLLQSLARLWDARQQRLLAAETTIPAVVWIVTLVGWADDRFRLFSRRSEPRHASCHVRYAGGLRRSGADLDYRSQQPVSRRLSSLDTALRPSLGADPGIEGHRSMTMSP